MNFNNHNKLAGLHAKFSHSQSSWLRYDDEKVIEDYRKKQAELDFTHGPKKLSI